MLKLPTFNYLYNYFIFKKKGKRKNKGKEKKSEKGKGAFADQLRPEQSENSVNDSEMEKDSECLLQPLNLPKEEQISDSNTSSVTEIDFESVLQPSSFSNEEQIFDPNTSSVTEIDSECVLQPSKFLNEEQISDLNSSPATETNSEYVLQRSSFLYEEQISDFYASSLREIDSGSMLQHSSISSEEKISDPNKSSETTIDSECGLQPLNFSNEKQISDLNTSSLREIDSGSLLQPSSFSNEEKIFDHNKSTVTDIVSECELKPSSFSNEEEHISDPNPTSIQKSLAERLLQSSTSDSSSLPESTSVIPFKYESITPNLPPKQPPGRLGRRVQLICNLFSIQLLPSGNVYHYDVQIIYKKRSGTSQLSMLDPEKGVQKYRSLSTKINRKVIDEMLKKDKNFYKSFVVYDGKSNLYSPKCLELKFPYTYEVVFEDDYKSKDSEIKKRDDAGNKETKKKEKDSFNIIIKPVNKGKKGGSCAISFEPLYELFSGRKVNADDIQEAVMALETIFRHTPALCYTPIYRSFFHPDLGNMHPLSGGVEIWFGYHQSSRLTQSKLMINLDTSATTFFSKGPLLNYFAESYGIPYGRLSTLTRIDNRKVMQISKEIKNLKIEVTHQVHKRKYCIIGVTSQKASELCIVDESNATPRERLEDYYKRRYKRTLNYPYLPCVQVKPENKNIYFPLELCEIVEGQHCRKELSKTDQNDMIKYTADNPKDKFRKINDIRRKYANYERDDYLNKFGIEVQLEPVNVTGREFEAPNLNYHNRKLQPREGSWNLRGIKFLDGAKIMIWYLLNLAERFCGMRDLRKFSDMMFDIGGASGLQIDKPPEITNIDGFNFDKNGLCRYFQNAKISNVSLIIVVIPRKDKDLYKMVKQVAEIECGLITQCIDHNNVLGCNPSLIANISQKINAKMGGVNHSLIASEIPMIMKIPTIVMGADVSHASVTEVDGVSVAAVVGSLNMTMTRYAATCKLQKNEDEKKRSIEMILELKEMIKSLLKEFKNHTRQKPQRIIFYRDGVSDGQFSDVKKIELVAIRSACRELNEDYRPAITFIVVQKRDHVRFKYDDGRVGASRNDSSRNIRPGTVIDTEIVHPLHRDFFLNSHAGMKGTNVPCHYTVLEDDSNFDPDELQKLTYYLCNLFVRCAKSISHPVPVRYAHLAAYRKRVHLPKKEDNKDKKRNESDILAELSEATEINNLIRHSMYYV